MPDFGEARIEPRNVDCRAITVTGAPAASSDTEGMSPRNPTSIAPDINASLTAGPKLNMTISPFRPLRSRMSVFASVCAICHRARSVAIPAKARRRAGEGMVALASVRLLFLPTHPFSEDWIVDVIVPADTTAARHDVCGLQCAKGLCNRSGRYAAATCGRLQPLRKV